MASRKDKVDITFTQHKSVLLKKLVCLLQPKDDDIFIDCTLGLGGHTEALINSVNEKCTSISIDRDLKTLQYTEKKLKTKFKKAKMYFYHDSFSNLDKVLDNHSLNRRCLLIADLGISSVQLDDPERGLSFKHNGPLDMRMDQSSGVSAKEYLCRCSENELSICIANHGEIRFNKAKRISRSIKKDIKNINTTNDLSSAILSNYSKEELRGKNPLPQIFQAIRIEINSELSVLEILLKKSLELLPPDSLIAFISFHSLEDRIVKKFLKKWSRKCVCPKYQLVCDCEKKYPKRLELITRKPVVPDNDEIASNLRSRSSKLRIAKIVQK